MSITDSLPKVYPWQYEKGQLHVGVWAIQNALGATRDGDFGPQTEAVVKDFQDRHGLRPDGKVGFATQEALVKAQCSSAYRVHRLPPGSLESVSKGESAYNPGAVNHAVPGGVDVSSFQRRVYEPFSRLSIERALRIGYQARLLAARLRERKDAFYERRDLQGLRLNSHERAWRLAILSHNWPYGADRLASGHRLSDKVAPWVPATTTFKDGARVLTYTDWAKFYSLGAPEHDHKGKMVELVTGWPA